MAFRGSKSSPQLNQFGVGSLVRGALSSVYLVVRVPCGPNNSAVALMNITALGELSDGNIAKFETGRAIGVDDPNFLTHNEFGLLVDTIGLQWTRSDFETSASGLKGVGGKALAELAGGYEL